MIKELCLRKSYLRFSIDIFKKFLEDISIRNTDVEQLLISKKEKDFPVIGEFLADYKGWLEVSTVARHILIILEKDNYLLEDQTHVRHYEKIIYDSELEYNRKK